jgi:hypothetical protein
MTDPNDADVRRRQRLWIQAGIALGQDPSARIVCPNCGTGVLVVTDEPIWDGSHIERWMRCDHCGAANTAIVALEGTDRGTTSKGRDESQDELSLAELVRRAAEDVFRRK